MFTMEKVDLEYLAGQLMFIGFPGSSVDEARDLISDIKPCGLVFTIGNIRNPEQVRRLTSEFNRYARELEIPRFLYAIDHEGGLIMRFNDYVTFIPSHMAVGSTGAPRYARAVAEIAGAELNAMGFNVDFAPVLDINTNPYNPIIGIRSFGSTPELVSSMGVEFIRGLHEKGIVATGKHFPGHGDTSVDSHLDLPVLTHDLELLKSRELKPFKAAVDAGIQLIMTAHVALPKIDKEIIPATFSRRIIEGILRRELGFRGAVITDSLLMKAVYDRYEASEIAAMALNAGCDILLMSYDENFIYSIRDSIVDNVRAGRISRKRILEAYSRVMNLRKFALQIKSRSYPLSVVGCTRHKEINRNICLNSIRVVRDSAKILPLKQGMKIVLLLPRYRSMYPLPFNRLEEEVIRKFEDKGVKCLTVPIDINPLIEEVEDCIMEVDRLGGDAVIVATYDAYRYKGQLELAKRIISSFDKSALIVLKEPTDYLMIREAKTIVLTYGISPAIVEAMVEVICGGS